MTALGRCTLRVAVVAIVAAAIGAWTTLTGAPSRADIVAYLVNVTVRPGFNFPNAEAAISYGHGICDKIARGVSYADVIGDVKNDFMTADEYQASYLITQSANELCPAQIWQLRRSAAGYHGAPA